MSPQVILSEWEEGETTLIPCPGCAEAYLRVIVRAGSASYPCAKCGRSSSVTITREICGWQVFTRITTQE